MPSSTKTLEAWVIGGRHRHHRTRDHFGADSDLYITIDEQIGPWGAGTPVKYVIQDLFERVNRLTSAHLELRVAHLNAFVLAPTTSSAPSVPGAGLGIKPLNAIVFKNMPHSFLLNAMVVVTQKAFSIDAFVPYRGTLYLNAFVV